jgi:Flp pilus assembly protein TadD
LRAWSTAEAPDGRVSARLAALLADRGELEEAERCASAALAEGAVEANDVLDRVLTASGRGSEVLGRARALADREPSCAHFLAVARIAQARGDTATAEEALKLGLARPDASREAREALAQLLEAQGRWPDAIAATREAVRADPANPHIVARLGRLLRQNGDIAGAETAFRSAIAIDGRFAGFHHELADVLAKSGRDAEALASSSRAVAIDPSDAHALVGLSNHLRRSGDFDGAETALRRACALQPSETSFAHALEQCLAERRAVNEEPSA